MDVLHLMRVKFVFQSIVFLMAFNDNDDVMEKGEVGDRRSPSDSSSEPCQQIKQTSQTKYSPSEFSTGTIAIIQDCLHLRMLTIF